MRLPRHLFPFLAVLFLVADPLLTTACKKDEPPPPANLPSDEDDKPKKKKKKGDDDDDNSVKPVGDDDTAGSSSVKLPTGTGTGGKSNAANKALLQACCTALHAAAEQAGTAEAAASAAKQAGIAVPAPPSKEEAEKQAKACDSAVNNFTGDLNASLKKIKGASPIALPSACNIGN